MKLETRKSYLGCKKAVISTSRKFRPRESRKEWSVERKLSPRECPFCPGNEKMTPPEIGRIGGRRWRVRVFENKFPAFSPNPPSPRSSGILVKWPSLGKHEVIVDTPNHYSELEEEPSRQITLAFKMFEKRLKVLGMDYEYALLIKNRGDLGGASLMHSHTQILAFNYIPQVLEEELVCAEEYYTETGKDPFEEILETESQSKRFVYENPEILVISPFAPRADYQVSFISKRKRFPKPSYIADAFKTVVTSMDSILGKGFPYNFYVHYPPFHEEYYVDFYRWNLQLIPRVQTWAGFELGTGDSIITVTPEDWAKALRNEIGK